MSDRRPTPRVVSLVPSVTETLLAWGVVPVAVTRFCEQPDLPSVGGTKNPEVAAIVDLRPDLVVMCDEENRLEDAEALAERGVQVHVVRIRALGVVPAALEELAAAVGVRFSPDQQWAEAVQPCVGSAARRAFVPIWRRPWMTLNGDTYASSLLAAVGVANVFAGEPVRYPEVDLRSVERAAPDLVLLPSEPYPFASRHADELSWLAPVVLVDGRDLFWWGIRTPQARARLRRALC